MNRSRLAATISAFFGARSRMAWCIVGTAVYQVGLASPSHAKNLSALNPGVQHTVPPALSGASNAAMRPWMWNSGITQSPTSPLVSERVRRMLCADAHTLRCASGTILGRDVVPDVCSTRAMSSGDAMRGACGGVGPAGIVPGKSSVKLPAPSPGRATNRAIGTPSFVATASAGVSFPAPTTSSFARRSVR